MLSEEEKRLRRNAYMRAWYQKNKAKAKSWAKRTKARDPERYKRLNRESIARMRAIDPARFKEINKRTRQRHQKRYTAMTMAWVKTRPGIYLFYNARYRARRLGIPFDITPEDVVIPAVCPVLGIAIITAAARRGFSPNSPSIDRIIPERGYVRGNIRVISMRANDLKRNGTPEELRKVAIYAHRETARVKRELGS